MTTLTRGLAALVCTLFLSTPLVSHAQLGGLLGGGGPGAPAPDLTCTGRGADGKLACGDIGLEETLDFCDDIDGDYVCDSKDECPDTPEGTPVFMNGCHEMALSKDRPWVLRGVNFEFDRAVLRSESIPILDAAVNVLNENPSLLVAIDGHTDDKGSEWYNENLSRERAKTVHNYFIDRGVQADRLVYRGFGESRPVAPNSFDDGSDNPEGRFENRRVELNVVDEETFQTVKAQIAEREAEMEAERARRAAERAEAAARAAEEEADMMEEDTGSDAASEEEASSSADDEFDASEYLNFAEEPESGDAEAVETDSASEPATDSPTEEANDEADTDASSDFDESDYLEFLNSTGSEE